MNRVYLLQTDTSDLSSAAWSLLEHIIGPLPAIARDLHGKPFFPSCPQLQFSLSHTAGAVACAISGSPCGVDIESVYRTVNPRIAKRFFTKQEIAYAVDSTRFLEIWTRKEAFIKCIGGIIQPLCKIETIGHSQIQTKNQNGFIVSFCCKNPQFSFCYLEQKDIS